MYIYLLSVNLHILDSHRNALRAKLTIDGRDGHFLLVRLPTLNLFNCCNEKSLRLRFVCGLLMLIVCLPFLLLFPTSFLGIEKVFVTCRSLYHCLIRMYRSPISETGSILFTSHNTIHSRITEQPNRNTIKMQRNTNRAVPILTNSPVESLQSQTSQVNRPRSTSGPTDRLADLRIYQQQNELALQISPLPRIPPETLTLLLTPPTLQPRVDSLTPAQRHLIHQNQLMQQTRFGWSSFDDAITLNDLIAQAEHLNIAPTLASTTPTRSPRLTPGPRNLHLHQQPPPRNSPPRRDIPPSARPLALDDVAEPLPAGRVRRATRLRRHGPEYAQYRRGRHVPRPAAAGPGGG